jgi:hypothetical protein
MTSSLVMSRPVRIIFLVLMVLAAAGCNGLRLGEAIFFWKTLAEYGTSPLYISLTGGFWLFYGLFAGWCLWQGKPWGRLVAIIGTAGYLSWYWIDRLLLQGQHSNWLFALFVHAIFLFAIISILFSQKTRLFFQREYHGRKSEPTTPA